MKKVENYTEIWEGSGRKGGRINSQKNSITRQYTTHESHRMKEEGSTFLEEKKKLHEGHHHGSDK